MRVSDLSLDSRFMALFVGPKHSGKTCAAASFTKINSPGRPRTMIYDFDGRIRGLLGMPGFDKYKDLIDYNYYPPKMGMNNKNVFEQLNQSFELLLAECRTDRNIYDTVIIDSMTAECFAFLCDSMKLTHSDGAKTKGKYIGSMAMAGPEDYGFESTGAQQTLAFLRSIPVNNIIVTAHVIPKYGKEDPTNPFSNSIIVGEQMALRDKINAAIPIYFDHIFRFDRKIIGNNEHFTVKFRSDIACTSYPKLPGGEIDITGMNFQDVLAKYNQGVPK